MPPKGFKKNIKLINQKVGTARRQELLDDIDVDGTFLPRGVGYADMDGSFIDMIKKDLAIVVDGKKVPVIFLTLQRWAEFNKTWEHSDEYKDIKLPFITIIRKNNIMPGTNQAGNWNEVGIRKYAYSKVATFDGARKGVDIYKVPQPTAVDIPYDIKFFCNRMRDINLFNSTTQLLFQSRQHYVYPNEHPMPVHLESVNDESKVDEFEKRKYYIQSLEMLLLGYILDEDEFEVVPTVNRLRVGEEIITPDVIPSIKVNKVDGVQNVNYSFHIRPQTNNRFSFTSEFDIKFTSVVTDNLTSLIFKVNGSIKPLPFSVMSGDIITAKFVKNFYESAEFTLSGVII